MQAWGIHEHGLVGGGFGVARVDAAQSAPRGLRLGGDCRNLCAKKRVKQRAFADVGLANDGDESGKCIEVITRGRVHKRSSLPEKQSNVKGFWCTLKSMERAYVEVIDFIASGQSATAIADFTPSEQAKERVAYLIAQEKNTGLTAEESSELEHYLQLEHFMRLAKARALCLK